MIDLKTVEQARNTDMLDFLEKHCGFSFVKQRGSYRCKQHPSLAINHDRLSWYQHSKSIGGYGVLDYLIKIENVSFPEAMNIVSDVAVAVVRVQQESEQPKKLILPKKAAIPVRLYDYLCCKRGIDDGIVNTLLQKGTIYQDRRGNVVFVGFDEQGKARFASLRGTYGDRKFKADCTGSDKRYSFNMAYSRTRDLYIFESALDVMSHASISISVTGDKDAWKLRNRLSLAGTSDRALAFFLNKHPLIKELIFSLDNDAAGREASNRLVSKYAVLGYSTRVERPIGKDFSDDLMEALTEKTRQKRVKNEMERY